MTIVYNVLMVICIAGGAHGTSCDPRGAVTTQSIGPDYCKALRYTGNKMGLIVRCITHTGEELQ